MEIARVIAVGEDSFKVWIKKGHIFNWWESLELERAIRKVRLERVPEIAIYQWGTKPHEPQTDAS